MKYIVALSFLIISFSGSSQSIVRKWKTIDDNTAFGVPDYFHYELSVGTNIAGVDLKLAWDDTDLKSSEADTGKFLVTVSKSF